MIRAAIDIGSNTVRLLIARIKDHRIQERLYYQHIITRLGQDLHQTGKLSNEAMQRTNDAISTFKQHINHFKNIEICATATAAIRQASNGSLFLQRLKHETGISVQLISEDCEAQLCLHGVMSECEQEEFLLFDIGGGSTEFSLIHNGKIRHTQSHPLGVVKLTETALKSDPPSLENLQCMQQHIELVLDQVEQQWGAIKKPSALVGTAGTVTTLAALDLKLQQYDAKQVNRHCITHAKFKTLKQQLTTLSHTQRASLPSLEAGRCDLIIAGLMIVDCMMTRWQYQSLTCIDSGLLEGLVVLGSDALQWHEAAPTSTDHL
ncbi:MAG: Ppx/GppA family phosphatase [Mariprofundaceae bacterium]|nr:Ppx/GppA family phosphatase [Mariprofundaceae bacterium]